jgi:hypothetical protein
MPSTKKVGKESNRGGARAGAGRPEGKTKEKISVSVDSDALQKALSTWKGKTSQLVEQLLKDYASTREREHGGKANHQN